MSYRFNYRVRRILPANSIALPRWALMVLGVLILVLLLVNIVQVGFLITRLFTGPGSVPTSTTQAIIASKTARPIAQTNFTSTARTIILPSPSPTLQPTITHSPVPTISPIPSSTTTLTLTATATPEMLVNDDMTDGPDPAWKITGNFFQINDFITPDGGALTLFMPGDWTDYRVSVKIGNWCDNVFCSSLIGLRAQDVENAVGIFGVPYKSGRFDWVVIRNGEQKIIPNTDFQYRDFQDTIEVEVTGSNFQAIVGPKITNTDFPTGGVVIKIQPNMKLFWVKVTALK